MRAADIVSAPVPVASSELASCSRTGASASSPMAV